MRMRSRVKVGQGRSLPGSLRFCSSSCALPTVLSKMVSIFFRIYSRTIDVLANRSRNESIARGAKKRGGGINWNTDTSMQLRRQARLRREYLYRKSQEDQEKSILERKRKLRDAVEGVYDQGGGGG